MTLLRQRNRRDRRRGLDGSLILRLLGGVNVENELFQGQLEDRAMAKMEGVVDNANLPESTKVFWKDTLNNRRGGTGILFSRFASEALTRSQAISLVGPVASEEESSTPFLDRIIKFIEDGGLELILSFILALVSAFG